MGEHFVDLVVTGQGVKMDRLQHSLGKAIEGVRVRYRKERLYTVLLQHHTPQYTKHHKTRRGAGKPTAYPKKEENAIFTEVFDGSHVRAGRPGSELGSTVASVDSELRPGHKSRGVTGEEDNCTLHAHKRQSSSSCHRTSITDIQILW